MMSTLERLCHESDAILRRVETQLMDYDKLSEDFIPNIEADIGREIASMNNNLERMDIYVGKEPISKRQNARLRVDQIRYDFQHLQASYRAIQNRRAARLQEERQREELLRTDFSKMTNGHTAINIDADLKYHSSAKNAHKGLDDLLGQGQEILMNIRTQGSSLKQIKGKILDVANKLGLSTSLMRMIERRGRQDKAFFYGGIFVTFAVMLFIYWVFKG